jgi:hypothetical protein
MLVELINDDRFDTKSTGSEEDQSEEIDKTWFPSSGFCVRKDMHETEVYNADFNYKFFVEFIVKSLLNFRIIMYSYLLYIY